MRSHHHLANQSKHEGMFSNKVWRRVAPTPASPPLRPPGIWQLPISQPHVGPWSIGPGPWCSTPALPCAPRGFPLLLDPLVSQSSSDVGTLAHEIQSAIPYLGIATLYEPKGVDERAEQHAGTTNLPVFSPSPCLQILPPPCGGVSVVQQPSSHTAIQVNSSAALPSLTLLPDFDMQIKASHCPRQLQSHQQLETLASPGAAAASVVATSDRCITTRTIGDDLRECEFTGPKDYIGIYGVVCNLEGKTEYNGILGLIRGFDSSSHRFVMKLAGVQAPISIRPSNVREVCGHPALVLCSFCRRGDATNVYGRCPYCGVGESLRIQALRREDPNHVYFQFLQDPSLQV